MEIRNEEEEEEKDCRWMRELTNIKIYDDLKHTQNTNSNRLLKKFQSIIYHRIDRQIYK